MRKAKILSFFIAIILLFSTVLPIFAANAAFSPSFELYSEGIYMVDLDDDTVVVSKNADEKLYPASTTKIMTCLVALANITDLDELVEVTYEAFEDLWSSNINFNGASTAFITPFQNNITYRDCIYSLMVCSACDSANILAYNIGGGSIAEFVEMMNDTAADIGCGNTHFSNPHGLFEEDNYTSARDMYLITKYAVDNYPEFMEICNTLSYDMPPNEYYPDGYTIYTTNKLINPYSEYYCEGVRGVKTGSIDRYFYQIDGEWDYDSFVYGSRTLVSTAQRDGETYMIVTLGAPYCNEDGSETETELSFTDHINLYEWAFSMDWHSDVVPSADDTVQSCESQSYNAPADETLDKVLSEESFETIAATEPQTSDLSVADVTAVVAASVLLAAVLIISVKLLITNFLKDFRRKK